MTAHKPRRFSPAHNRAGFRQRKLARRQVQGLKETEMAKQCFGITRSGAQCNARTNDASGYCPMHRDQATARAGANRTAALRRPAQNTTAQSVVVAWIAILIAILAPLGLLLVFRGLGWWPGPERTIETVEVTQQPNPLGGAESAGGGYWWPSDRINPEANPIRQGEEGNWEDISGNWRLPDGSSYAGIRKVDLNGQKYGVWLDAGPYGLTGPEVLRLLVPDSRDQGLVIRVSPEGPCSGGWWTLETLKPGASESLVAGYLVPAGGATVTFSTAAGGRFDYWRGFAAPTPSGICTGVATSQDADSGLENWQIVCEIGSNASFKSDGVSWYPPNNK